MAKKKSANTTVKGNGANLGFEQKLWAAADKMRSQSALLDWKRPETQAQGL